MSGLAGGSSVPFFMHVRPISDAFVYHPPTQPKQHRNKTKTKESLKHACARKQNTCKNTVQKHSYLAEGVGKPDGARAHHRQNRVQRRRLIPVVRRASAPCATTYSKSYRECPLYRQGASKKNRCGGGTPPQPQVEPLVLWSSEGQVVSTAELSVVPVYYHISMQVRA
eukprot:COSAG05_NODE_1534_length_4616_cov_6.656409_3_plen_168_part_00